MRNDYSKQVGFAAMLLICLFCTSLVDAQNLKPRQNSLENVQLSQVDSPSTSSDQSPFEAVKGLKEDSKKRDAFSKHYINGDGSFTALIGAGPIHYEKNGQFHDIEHRITQSFDSNFPYANTTNLFESHFGANSHTGVKNKTIEGEIHEFLHTKMYWEVNGQAFQTQQSAKKNLRIEGDKAYYDNIYGNISAEFITLTGKRKLNYIIPNKQALGSVPAGADYLVFTEDVVLPFGWTSTITDSGVMIKDQLGQEIYLYENPHSTDAESHALREENTIFETLQIGNTLTIKTKVKTDWLLSNDRQFPVLVDPTVVDASAVGSRSVYNTNSYTSNNGYFGRNNDGITAFWLQYHIKFDVSSVPIGSIIEGVTGSIYRSGTSGNSGTHSNNQWHWSTSSDPTVTSTNVSLYNSASSRLSNSVVMTSGNGWKSIPFISQESVLNYVKEGVDDSRYVNATVRPDGTYNIANMYVVHTHSGTNKPYLRITYTEPITDRTLEVAGAGIGASHADDSYTYDNDTPLVLTSGTRAGYEFMGWTGTGSVPATGTTNSISFNITQNSSIEWLWEAIQPEFHNYGGEEQLAFNNSKINTENPVFRLSHKGGTANGYQIQISNSADFTSGTVSQTFTGTYAAETENNFTFTEGSFISGATYYVRAAVDMGGGYLTDGWTTQTYSFTYQTPKEIPDWFQTTQAQFQTNVLSGLSANASHNVVANPGGNIIQNGSFQSGTANWAISKPSWFTVAAEPYGNTDGTHALNIYNSNPGYYGNFFGDTAGVYQTVDMTGVSDLTVDLGYESTNGSSLLVNIEIWISEISDTNLRLGTKVLDWRPTANVTTNNSLSIDLNPYLFTGNKLIKIVAYHAIPSTDYAQRFFYVDNLKLIKSSSGSITSTLIHLASVQDAIGYEGITWSQTLGGGEMTLKVQQSADGISGWADVLGYTDISAEDDGEQYFDLSEMEAFPHIRLVGDLNGEDVTLHDWSVQFIKDDKCANTTIWDGTAWSNGIPTSSDTKIVFNGNFTSGTGNTTAGELIGCMVEVQSGNVIISEGHNITIDNEITVGSGATFTLKDDANLVQINEEEVVNTGDIKVERTFTFSPERQQYNFVNSPVVGLNIKDIYPGEPRAQYYHEPTNKFIFYDGAYQAGRGVALSEPSTEYVASSTTVAEFEGVPFNGTLTLTGLTGDKTGFHLMGNPYPSQLDLDEFYADNSDVIEGRFLFWDNRGNTQITQYGDGYNGNHYAQYNASNSTGTAAATAVGTFKIPNGKLAVGSATMIRLQYGVTNTSVVLNNSQRTTGTSVNFFGKVATSTEKDRYWLTMDTPGGLSVMNAVVYFEGGNDAYGMDDNTSAGGSDDFYTMADSKKLAIQGKAPFEVSDSITVGYKAFEPGAYKINLHEFEGVFAENVRIYLIDQETQTSHNLSESSYSFESEAGEFQKRFLIVYQTEEVEEPEEPLITVDFDKSGLAVYKHANQTVILSNQQDLEELKIFNIQGQLLLNKKDISDTSYRFDNNRFGKQTLVLVVKTADGKEHKFKVLTH